MSGRALRIGLVVPGGVDRSGRHRVIPALLWFIERLARHHDVHVFVLRYLRDPADYPLLGASVHDLGQPAGRPGWRSVHQWRKLVGTLRRHGPFDVIHGLWATPAGMMTSAAARLLGVPSVVTFDSGEFVSRPDIDYGLQATWRGRLAVRLASDTATQLHVCSEYMADAARRRGLRPVVIPMGVDRARFAPARDSTDWRRHADAAVPSTRLLHVASLNRVKGLPLLLHALALVRSELPDTHLDVVGEDTLGGEAERACHRLGLSAHVTFHGVRTTEALPPFYHRADLLVLPSYHEAAGVVVLEAAAAGVPTVGSRVGYVSDWAPDAACAVPPADPGALARAIVALLKDHHRRAELAAAAHARVAAFDADVTVNTFEALYERLARRPARLSQA